MARRHEDRGPGERFQRRPRPGGSSRRPRGGSRTGGAPAWGRRDDGGPGRPDQRPGGPRRPARRAQGLIVTPAKEKLPDDGRVRLNRFLAMAGVCSRRGADAVILSGRVEVNGTVVRELGVRVDPVADDVRVDGDRLHREKPTYVLFNKPAGVVCTNARQEQKTRVIDLLPEIRGRLYTVGRLDMDSEGLILLTNDGDFALQMTHPRYGVPKTYSVVLRGHLDAQALKKARGGVWLAEGPTTGMQIKVERAGRERTWLKVVLREGRNREIRRVFAKLEHPVISLKRVRIGELSLHGLAEGQYRFLDLREVRELLAVARREDPAEGTERDDA
jgi:23S rRNA pseudouridine2605 synthase